jgi:hypothetical protein
MEEGAEAGVQTPKLSGDTAEDKQLGLGSDEMEEFIIETNNLIEILRETLVKRAMAVEDARGEVSDRLKNVRKKNGTIFILNKLITVLKNIIFLNIDVEVTSQSTFEMLEGLSDHIKRIETHTKEFAEKLVTIPEELDGIGEEVSDNLEGNKKSSLSETALAPAQAVLEDSGQEKIFIFLTELRKVLENIDFTIEDVGSTSQSILERIEDVASHIKVLNTFAKQPSELIPKEVEGIKHEVSDSLKYIPKSSPPESSLEQAQSFSEITVHLGKNDISYQIQTVLRNMECLITVVKSTSKLTLQMLEDVAGHIKLIETLAKQQLDTVPKDTENIQDEDSDSLKDILKFSPVETALAQAQGAQEYNVQEVREVALQEFRISLKTIERILEIAEATPQYTPRILRIVVNVIQQIAHFADQITEKFYNNSEGSGKYTT